MHAIFFSLCHAFSARHFPLAGLGCATFPFRVGFRLFVSPPATMTACGRVLTLVSFVVAPAFSFSSLFFVSPPPATLAVRGRFLTVVCLIIAPFRLAPPATLAVRGRFLTVDRLIKVSAFPSIAFLRVFPGFIAKPFRRVRVGFEEPHLRLMF